MNKSTEELTQIYDSFEEILDNVRAIVRTNAPLILSRKIIRKINSYEDSILGLRSNFDEQGENWKESKEN
jgi:archaellum biogenesis ATPase FlaH|tara:strand:+ start:1090 stop:1299 length:210 start_codon:yes stop_codon:yes gene_type:complete